MDLSSSASSRRRITSVISAPSKCGSDRIEAEESRGDIFLDSSDSFVLAREHSQKRVEHAIHIYTRVNIRLKTGERADECKALLGPAANEDSIFNCFKPKNYTKKQSTAIF
mmetsp:Transcript_14187/g.28298  ORF Transcript_14187/g.28298 Transcript_14187/m.28298 type:complete len:111 (+) Transcript_14187:1908-2240(+)